MARRARPGPDRWSFRPSAFQAGHIPSWHGSCERYALSLVAGACRWLLLLLSPLLSAAFRGIGCAGVTRLCAWCENPIPARARRDAVCCSVRCRQARHRFLRAVGYAESVAPGRPLRLAYADPPYPGKTRLYRDHADYGGEVDHAVLIGRLAAYDGWALYTSAGARPAVLALCPAGVRVAAWHRGERPARSRQVTRRARPRADASSPAASDTSYPSSKASHDAYAQLPLEFAR